MSESAEISHIRCIVRAKILPEDDKLPMIITMGNVNITRQQQILTHRNQHRIAVYIFHYF